MLSFFSMSLHTCHADNHYRRNAEMENEIADLRRRLATGEHDIEAGEGNELNPSSGEVYYDANSPPSSSRAQSQSVSADHQPSPMRPSLPPHVASDTPVSHGSGSTWVLEDISLSKQRVDRLFEQ
jgi:hypothetical protein